MNTAALVCSVSCLVGMIVCIGWLVAQAKAGVLKGDDEA